MRREKYYIYHYCLNENLPKKHKDHCNNCWVGVASGGASACSPQNWRYCDECVKKGYKQVSGYTEGRKIREKLITEATGREFKVRVPMSEERKKILRETLAKARAKKKMDSAMSETDVKAS